MKRGALCNKDSTPWFHINGHICQDCYENSRNAKDPFVTFELAKCQKCVNELYEKLENNKWISVKDQLPDDNTFVKVKMRILFISVKTALTALYFKKYFNIKGENATRWVTHWMPLPEVPNE